MCQPMYTNLLNYFSYRLISKQKNARIILV